MAGSRPARFARHPDWQPQFDIDGPLAVTSRKKLLDRAAADRMLVTVPPLAATSSRPPADTSTCRCCGQTSL